MNLGQLLECHLGWAAQKMGYKVAVPSFGGFREEDLQDALKDALLSGDGKVTLYDGKTGESYKEKVAVGIGYIMKLVHMVDEKVHARSTGPYSLVTQQPLGGKAQMGGQRLGEMEVWALESYGAAHSLQEMLTIKSDDVVGRAKTFEAIIKGTDIPESSVPESFKVLIKELNGLGLKVELLGAKIAKEETTERQLVKEEVATKKAEELALASGSTIVAEGKEFISSEGSFEVEKVKES